MENLSINAEKRNSDEKVKELRKSKMVPGVVYGHSQEPISLKVDASDLLKLFRVAGESHIVKVNVDKKKFDVLIHDSQRDPVTGDFTHIDFYAITKGEKLTAKIRISFEGEAPAVKEGAILQELVKEIEVKCLPTDLVDSFKANLSSINNIGDSIKVDDLGIDTEKYEITIDLEEPIIIATETKAEAEPEETEGGEGEEGEAVEGDAAEGEDKSEEAA